MTLPLPTWRPIALDALHDAATLLRVFEGEPCASCGAEVGHHTDCELVAVLLRVEHAIAEGGR